MSLLLQCGHISVALFTRAWIEIFPKSFSPVRYGVALFTRAWIEIVLPKTKVPSS